MRGEPRRFWTILGIGCVLVIAGAILLTREVLFGAGPTAIHDPARLAATIHVCGRDYRAEDRVTTRAAFGQESPFVLIDPAPFAPCDPVVDDPTSMCTSGAVSCATWTVLYVRVGPDAYAGYELVGGP